MMASPFWLGESEVRKLSLALMIWMFANSYYCHFCVHFIPTSFYFLTLPGGGFDCFVFILVENGHQLLTNAFERRTCAQHSTPKFSGSPFCLCFSLFATLFSH